MASERTYPEVQFSDSEQSRLLGRESRNRFPLMFGLMLAFAVVALLLAIRTRAYYWHQPPFPKNVNPSDSKTLQVPRNELPANVREILDGADKLEMFVIGNPEPRKIEGFQSYSPRLFETVTDPGDRSVILSAIYAGIEHDDPSAIPCFDPGYALRAEFRGHSVALIICFECDAIAVYLDDHPFAGVGTAEDAKPIFQQLRSSGQLKK